MTQGEILSSIAHIDTLVEICEKKMSKKNKAITSNDVNMMMPFVTKAKEVAEKLSCFAFDNYNSDDENKRKLSDIICRHFLWHESFVHSIDFKGNGFSDETVDWLNNNIQSIKRTLFNTYTACGVLSQESNNEGESIDDLREDVIKITAENARLKEQLEQQKPDNKQEEVEELKAENERLRKDHEEMIVDMLMPIFYKIEKDVREFLKTIDGRPDTEIIDTVHEWVKARKISEKSKGRALWSVLHAAKYYSSTESNWNTALRNYPKGKPRQ